MPNHAHLPEPGEQLDFEAADAESLHERTTMRIGAISPGHAMGFVLLEGWRIVNGWPVEEMKLDVSVTAVEARRIHRRCRT